MSSLCVAQQYAFEAFLAFRQCSPSSRFDLGRFRRFVHEIQQTNADLPRLEQEVIEEIFARSSGKYGSRSLAFPEFEKALIMYSMVVFPHLSAVDAYLTIVKGALMQLRNVSLPKFPTLSMDQVSIIADLLMEKSDVSCFDQSSSITVTSYHPTYPVNQPNLSLRNTGIQTDPPKHDSNASIPPLPEDPESILSMEAKLGIEFRTKCEEYFDDNPRSAFSFFESCGGSCKPGRGKITISAFIFGCIQIGFDHTNKNRKTLFRFLDRDKDGVLSFTDFISS